MKLKVYELYINIKSNLFLRMLQITLCFNFLRKPNPKKKI